MPLTRSSATKRTPTKTSDPPIQPSDSTLKRSKDAPIQPPSSPLPAPSLHDSEVKYGYAIARGEMGVLTYEPYKSLILPFWAFRTVPVAQASATALMHIFASYVERGDFVGADMARKFIQMGMTRARRYANHKGGRKYAEDGQVKAKWAGGDEAEVARRREKEEASELFKGYWRRCIEDEGYQRLKGQWQREKKEWEKGQQKMVVKKEVKKEAGY